MEIKVSLSEQEYQAALARCPHLGLNKTYDSVAFLAKQAITRGVLPAQFPLGSFEAWAKDGQVGIGFTLGDGDGDFVDLAMAEFANNRIKVYTWENMCTEDHTREFFFGKKDIKIAFEEG